jgi:hypothetical protein
MVKLLLIRLYLDDRGGARSTQWRCMHAGAAVCCTQGGPIEYPKNATNRNNVRRRRLRHPYRLHSGGTSEAVLYVKNGTVGRAVMYLASNSRPLAAKYGAFDVGE